MRRFELGFVHTALSLVFSRDGFSRQADSSTLTFLSVPLRRSIPEAEAQGEAR
jgi:hypothetical protein